MECYNLENLILATVENIKSIQDRIDCLNSFQHKDVKNINDIKSLSEAQKNFADELLILEQIKSGATL